MTIRLEKPWLPIAEPADLPGQVGVFQLGNAEGEVRYIGYAGGRSRFGLRSAITDALAHVQDATHYRLEINTAYLTRYQELLMVHQADHGQLPCANEPVDRLGRLSPA
jgi:hypothetical protein